ncbi:MAG: tetratricopeptide repeat protein, partial [Limisphaerales bacterium]
MQFFFLGFISVALAAAVAQGETNPASNAPAALASGTNNLEQEALDKIMREDDAAMDQVDSWIRENNAFAAHGAGESRQDLNRRIRARLQLVRQAYEGFLKQHPTNAAAYLAYGSFLEDIGDEDGASAQYEKSRKLDPRNPAVWNDLANYYGENGPVTNAFAYYAKAVELNPSEPVYYENWATTVYLFRKDAREFYHI